jgi:hypothetical protein
MRCVIGSITPAAIDHGAARRLFGIAGAQYDLQRASFVVVIDFLKRQQQYFLPISVSVIARLLL